MNYAFPGTCIGELALYNAGEGTYSQDGRIYSALHGQVVEQKKSNKSTLTVVPNNPLYLPTKGDKVFAQVLNIRKEAANVKIYGLDSMNTYRPCNVTGTIKRENIRNYESDKIKVEQCFLPGDVIRAVVLTSMISHSLFLSTADEDCGVLYLKCENCNIPMMPMNWHQFKCNKCESICERKVAKPVM